MSSIQHPNICTIRIHLKKIENCLLPDAMEYSVLQLLLFIEDEHLRDGCKALLEAIKHCDFDDCDAIKAKLVPAIRRHLHI